MQQFNPQPIHLSHPRVVFKQAEPPLYARPGDAGRFNLQYLNETRTSNRGICLSPLGRTRVVELDGTC